MTPLLFARFAIVVPIHLNAWAIFKEELCLGAGRHLRAMGSTVAMEGAGGRCFAGWRFVCCLWRCALGGLAVSVGTQGDHESKRNEAPQQTGLVGTFTGFAQAIRFFGLARGTHNVLCLPLPVLADSDFVREALAEPGPLTIPGKGRYVGEYLRPALSGCDEAKAAIIVPFCKRAVYVHKYSSLAPLIPLAGMERSGITVRVHGIVRQSHFVADTLMRRKVSKHFPSSCFVSLIILFTTNSRNEVFTGSGTSGRNGTRLG